MSTSMTPEDEEKLLPKLQPDDMMNLQESGILARLYNSGFMVVRRADYDRATDTRGQAVSAQAEALIKYVENTDARLDSALRSDSPPMRFISQIQGTAEDLREHLEETRKGLNSHHLTFSDTIRALDIAVNYVREIERRV